MSDLDFDLNAPAAPSLTLDAAPAAPTLTLDPEADAKVVEEAKKATPVKQHQRGKSVCLQRYVFCLFWACYPPSLSMGLWWAVPAGISWSHRKRSR